MDKERCWNEGCYYRDIRGKVQKHNWYWCERRTECYLCSEELQGATPAQHYPTCRRVTKDVPCFVPSNLWSRWFLVESDAGPMLCQSGYNEDRFWLKVRAPVSACQLSWYRCRVQLECAGDTCTYIPHLMSHDECDWVVDCEDLEFLSGPDVRVWVNITG